MSADRVICTLNVYEWTLPLIISPHGCINLPPIKGTTSETILRFFAIDRFGEYVPYNNGKTFLLWFPIRGDIRIWKSTSQCEWCGEAWFNPLFKSLIKSFGTAQFTRFIFCRVGSLKLWGSLFKGGEQLQWSITATPVLTIRRFFKNIQMATPRIVDAVNRWLFVATLFGESSRIRKYRREG